MKSLSYARSLHDLGVLKASGMEEVILEHQTFSRLGKLNQEHFIQLARRARELKLRVLLDWDILMTQEVFETTVAELPALLPYIDELRVQDPGALNWALHSTTLPLQFIAENGNHNLESLKGWCELAGPRLSRLVLSIELPREQLASLVSALPVPCELLGFGRILLFYSPRALLSPLNLLSPDPDGELRALGESEESPHKGFPVIENRHGTFMFHIKEFCLIEYAADLARMGLGYFRIDLRQEGLSSLQALTGLMDSFDAVTFAAFREQYPQDLMRGFYLVNKTDVLFPKLKNARRQQREGNYLGEVLEAEKGSHLAILVKHPNGLSQGQWLRLLHPKGEVFEVQALVLRDLSLTEVARVPAGKVALIPFINGVWVKSQVFYQ